MLGNDPDLIDRTIDSLILSHEISAQVLPGDDGEDVVALYQPSTYRAESEVARRLREMIDAMPDTMATDLSAQIDELERVEGIAFHAPAASGHRNRRHQRHDRHHRRSRHGKNNDY